MAAMEALASREAGPSPRRADFSPLVTGLGEYLRACEVWRVIWRDTRLNHDEQRAKCEAFVDDAPAQA